MKKLFALVLALLILVMPVCVLAGDGDNVIIRPGTDIEYDVNTAFIEPDTTRTMTLRPLPCPPRKPLPRPAISPCCPS